MNGLTSVFKIGVQFGFDLFSKSFSNELPQPPGDSKYRITEDGIQRATEDDLNRITEGISP